MPRQHDDAADVGFELLDGAQPCCILRRWYAEILKSLMERLMRTDSTIVPRSISRIVRGSPPILCAYVRTLNLWCSTTTPADTLMAAPFEVQDGAQPGHRISQASKVLLKMKKSARRVFRES